LNGGANPFGHGPLSWGGAAWRAVLIEAAILLLLLPGLVTSGGADNPIWFYSMLALQFPASLLFEPTSHLAAGIVSVGGVADLEVAGAVVVLTELALMVVLLRKPWRNA
jgi:hypothetical protein